MFSPPGLSEVDQIIANPDPVTRNLQITQCYHELSAALAQRTGPIANWCTFATWASRQAGQTIRKEDLLRALEALLSPAASPQGSLSDPLLSDPSLSLAAEAQSLEAQADFVRLRQSVWEIWNPAEAFDLSSAAVARGNQKVFAEIGREFSRFLSTCQQDETCKIERIERFGDDLRPGDPPEGQGLLRQAFMTYYQAFFENNLRRRSELLLLANLAIGLHEQTRLQPEILEALEAPYTHHRQFRRRLFDALLQRGDRVALLRLFFTHLLGRSTLLGKGVDAYTSVVRRQVRLIITARLMTLDLPRGRRLRLGDDLRIEFPASLLQLENQELRRLLAQIDPTPDSTQASGAADWADLAERIHFIADMFRCFLGSAALWDPPFTAIQVADLKAGRLPAGRL